MVKRFLPIFGVLISAPLFLIAAMNYPGGNDWNTNEKGFYFAKNYISALYQARAINGSFNSARVFAIPAMVTLCVCIAFMFLAISKHSHSPVMRKFIEIFGIGTTVYACLGVLTPMHDLLVLIAAAFFGVAVIAVVVSLHKALQLWAVLGGLFCFALLLALGAMRHAILRADLAPLTEWMLFASTSVWVSLVYYVASAPNNSFKADGSAAA